MKNENTYEGKNRAWDCNYVRYLVAKIPDFLLDRHTFVIVDGPCVIIRVLAGQELQIGRDKGAVSCTIVLTTRRQVCVCIFLLVACCDMLGGWWCRVFKLDNSLVYKLVR